MDKQAVKKKVSKQPAQWQDPLVFQQPRKQKCSHSLQ